MFMSTVAADLLRNARVRAGLSQAELARRAGIPRSVLCAYERGNREPGTNALAHILAAAGLELRLASAVPRPDPERAARILSDVLDLAEALPYRPRPTLDFPPLRGLMA